MTQPSMPNNVPAGLHEAQVACEEAKRIANGRPLSLTDLAAAVAMVANANMAVIQALSEQKGK